MEQPTGGNDVLSYLDIAAPDSMGLERLTRILWSSPSPPANIFGWTIDAVSFRFVSERVEDPVSEFLELRRHAVLLIDPKRPSSTDGQELPTALLAPGEIPGGDVSKNLFLLAMGDVEIIAQDVPGVGIVYRLGTETAARFLEHGVLAATATLNVAYEDLDELKRVWGADAYHERIALALTGITQAALRGLGGYRVEHRPEQPGRTEVATREIPGQIEGYWLGPRSDPAQAPPKGWPTGALLRSEDGARALDLVFIERAWFPLSEAALYTYPHTFGLQGGEQWRFLCKDSNEIFEVAIGPFLTADEVARHYGPEALARSRPSYKTVQLLLKVLPR
ncbi:MAG TPA: hypothetical protein VNO30_20455 [Kofleriaceae bacterium]|nr:hypothetical protein [Kofleriaceae bacterium]